MLFLLSECGILEISIIRAIKCNKFEIGLSLLDDYIDDYTEKSVKF